MRVQQLSMRILIYYNSCEFFFLLCLNRRESAVFIMEERHCMWEKGRNNEGLISLSKGAAEFFQWLIRLDLPRGLDHRWIISFRNSKLTRRGRLLRFKIGMALHWFMSLVKFLRGTICQTLPSLSIAQRLSMDCFIRNLKVIIKIVFLINVSS